MPNFELIEKYCKVLAKTDKAILYRDGGRTIADINGASFTCNDVVEFYQMIELFGDDNFSE